MAHYIEETETEDQATREKLINDILKGTSNNDVFGARLDRRFRPTSVSNA